MAQHSELSKNQQLAARYVADGLANSDITKKCKISESSLIRWKRLDTFQQAVEDFKVAAAAASFENLRPDDAGDIKDGQSIEQGQLEKLDEIIKKLSSLTIEIIGGCEAEDISPRALPGLIKALTGSMECRRTGGDRITGMDLILDELNKAEEIFSEKINPSVSRS